MTPPKLTIGIPTLNRPEMLQQAIESCLKQTIPVHIVVADQGHEPETAEVLRRYGDHPHVEHILTEATCLWENWEAAALACDTPYFAWLQDDDVVARGYANRIVHSFERWPDVLHWQARCLLGKDAEWGAWWSWNGPMMPMQYLAGKPAAWEGTVIVPVMYLTSWALSPGVAFRCGEAFNSALEQMPTHCDLFSERLILAYMGAQGRFAADPVIAGQWIHHGQNESYKQHKNQEEQQKVCFEHLDKLMDTIEWGGAFQSWCEMIPVMNMLGMIQSAESIVTPHKEAIIKTMQKSLEGRIEVVKPTPKLDPAIAWEALGMPALAPREMHGDLLVA